MLSVWTTDEMDMKVTGHSIEIGLSLLGQTTSLPRNRPFYNRVFLR